MNNDQPELKNEAPAQAEQGEAGLLNDDIGVHFTNKRITNELRRGGIQTIGDLVNRGDLNLLRLPMIGPKSYREIVAGLGKIGLKLKKTTIAEYQDEIAHNG